MAADRLRNCESTFEAELSELESSFLFALSALKVFAKADPLLQAPDGDELKKLVFDWKRSKINDLSVIYRALFVQIWFCFEDFVRRCLTTYLDEFIARKPDFATLDKHGLARRNLQYTGIVLQHIIDNRPQFSVDFFSLAKNASTSVPGSSKVDLNSIAFSAFLSGPSPDGLKDALKRIGIDLDWDDLGRQTNLQKAFGLRRTRETANAARDYLKITVKRRHNIVHKAENAEAISETDVSDGFRIFGALGAAIISLLKEDLETKCK